MCDRLCDGDDKKLIRSSDLISRDVGVSVVLVVWWDVLVLCAICYDVAALGLRL